MEIVKISETKFIRKIKSLPISTQRITGIMVLLVLFIALPLFIWAVVTQRVFFKKQAASGEMSGEPGVCIAYNNFVDVTPVTDASAPCHDIQSAINAVANNGTVMIEPGLYNINSTINVNGKTNITITGNTYYSNDAAVLNFIPNGWGFLVQNSSGSIQKLKIQGGSSNGMISILNSSNFQLGYLKVNSNTSHTIDVQGSTNVNIHNSEISSSAGALEIQNSSYTTISNNKIINSSNAVAINNSNGTVMTGNLIASNRESGLYIYNANDTVVNHNTFNNNSMTSSSAAISLNGAITLLNFSNNLVIYTHTAGIAFSGSTFTRTFGNNDLWNNLGGNYVGFDDYTGVNGNISEDPLVDYSGINFNWCLRSGSPAIYGNPNSFDVIGSLGLCGTSSPAPSPTANPVNCNKPIFIQLTNLSSQNGEPGQKVRFNLSIENVNNSPSCGNYVSHLIVDKPSNWSAVFEQADFNIAGGQTINTYLDITPPINNYTLGDQVFPIRLSTDRYGVLGNESVNYHLKSPLSDADLTVTNITIERSSPPQTACESYIYKVTVKNIGTEPALKTRLRTYLDPSQLQTINGCNQTENYSGSNSPIPDTESKSYLEPGESMVYSDYFNPSNDGQVNIRAVADEDSILTEHNEYNNHLSKNFDIKKVYPAPDPIPGDVNSDGHVNIVDIGILIDNYRLSPPNDPRADINNDGVVNIVDIGIIIDNYEL